MEIMVTELLYTGTKMREDMTLQGKLQNPKFYHFTISERYKESFLYDEIGPYFISTLDHKNIWSIQELPIYSV